MNRVVLIGRLTKDPDVRQSGDTQIARYTLAVNRRGKQDAADFINCVTFNGGAAFAAMYLKKGMLIGVEGRIQTGKYEKNGETKYTTDVIVSDHEFLESKKDGQREEKREEPMTTDGFMHIPDGIDEELPFS